MKRFHYLLRSRRTYLIIVCILIGSILRSYRIWIGYALLNDTFSEKSWVRDFLRADSDPVNHIISQYTPYRSEILDLLGYSEPKTYLILLMNSAEKKPNGGFFGSYATVILGQQSVYMGLYDLFAFSEPVKNQTTLLQPSFHDAYYPLTIKKVTLPFPSRMSGLVELRHMTFLGANRLGFTDSDGENIKTLYEQTFDTRIDGVIFINDKLFSLILPEYESLKTKRQFQNTYADQIAQTGLVVKKQKTLTEMNTLISRWNIPTLMSRLISHIPTIQQQKLIQWYIPQTSSGLQQLFVSQGFTTHYSTDKIFLRDMSFGMNKIDRFVSKITTLYSGDILIAQTSGDIVAIPSILPPLLTIQIQYQLSVSSRYLSEIQHLEQDFGITPYPIQRIVLGQSPQRFTQGIIHLPSSRSVINSTGSAYWSYQTQSPFSMVYAYRIASQGLFNDQKIITLNVRTQ